MRNHFEVVVSLCRYLHIARLRSLAWNEADTFVSQRLLSNTWYHSKKRTTKFYACKRETIKSS